MFREGFNRRPNVNYFYFVVPERLKEKALEVVRELYPYAGLLVCGENIRNIFGYYGEPSNVYSIKPAKRMQRPISVAGLAAHIGSTPKRSCWTAT